MLLLDQDVVDVGANLPGHLLHDRLDGVHGDAREEVRVLADAPTRHRGAGDRAQRLLVRPLDVEGEAPQPADRFRGRHPVAIHDDRRVDLLLNQRLGLFQQLAREDDGARGAVPDLVVLGLGDLDEHLRGRVLDLDFLEDRDPVVRDRHVAEGVDEHLVHALRPQGRLDRVRDRARRGDVVEHRALALLALGPFLQNDDWLTAHHENSRGSIRGLLYECCGGGPCQRSSRPSSAWAQRGGSLEAAKVIVK